MTVILRLFFFGLVAFTPDDFQCDGDMRALLIDARRPPVASDGCPIHPHTPALFYSVAKPADCRHPCKYDRGLCRCDLDGGSLLDIGRREDDLCFQKDKCDLSASNGTLTCPQSEELFDYVVKLRPLRIMRPRMELDPACNKVCPGCRPAAESADHPIGMCKLVAAQINFHPIEFSICRMAGQPEDGSLLCPRFDRAPLASTNFTDLFLRPRQIPETVLFETSIKTKDKDKDKVTLSITSFDGGRLDTIEVPVFEEHDEKTNEEKYYADLVIANFMDEVDHGRAYSRCDQNFVARDFELFHDLVRRPLVPTDRPILRAPENAVPEEFPGNIEGQGYNCDANILRAFSRDILRAGDSRPICPQAAVSK